MDVDGFVAALNRHDWDAATSYYTDDGVHVDHVEGTRDQGKEAIKAWLKKEEAEFSSDFRLTIVDTIETPDRFAIVYDLTGTHDRSSQQPPLPATGKSYSIRGVAVGRLEGDKIKEETLYYNLAEFLAQVGLMPAPAATSG
jgi:steroid delta-isomerase-like uncharacterized protein